MTTTLNFPAPPDDDINNEEFEEKLRTVKDATFFRQLKALWNFIQDYMRATII